MVLLSEHRSLALAGRFAGPLASLVGPSSLRGVAASYRQAEEAYLVLAASSPVEAAFLLVEEASFLLAEEAKSPLAEGEESPLAEGEENLQEAAEDREAGAAATHPAAVAALWEAEAS